MSEEDKDAFAKFVGDKPWKDVSPLKAWDAALEYARTPQPAKSDSHGVTKINGANFRGFQLGFIEDPKHHSYGWVVYENPDKNGWVFLQYTALAHRDQSVQELLKFAKDAVKDIRQLDGTCPHETWLELKAAVEKFESRGSNET